MLPIVASRLARAVALAALLALDAGACLGAGLATGPQPCALAADPVARAAVAEAEARWRSHWQPAGAGWITDYALKPAPHNPLGLDRLPGAAAATPPITGRAAIEAMSCTFYETAPETAVVVRFTGRNLRFDENGTGFTRPIRDALIEVLVVKPASGPGLPARLMPLPDARIALAPDMVLSLPTQAGLAAPVGGPVPKRR